MMFFKKKQNEESKTENEKREATPTATKEAANFAAKETDTEAGESVTEETMTDKETEAAEEQEAVEEDLESIGEPLTRQVRLTVDTLADKEGTKVERKVRDCDRAILITESLAGAYRVGDSGDFREKYNCNCTVIGYHQADQLLNAMITATILNLKNVSGQDNKKALYANAVKAAQMILNECGVTNEYAEIAATDKLMQLFSTQDEHQNN